MDDAAADYNCPHCEQTVQVTDPAAQDVVQCPHCNEEFSIPRPVAPEEAELDGLKIRQLSTMRRAAYRSRSYALIAAASCAVVAAQLGWLAFRHVKSLGWDIRPIIYLLLVPVALWGAWHFLGRAQAMLRETEQSALTEPTVPPDFSTLSDGSQRMKNLEELR